MTQRSDEPSLRLMVGMWGSIAGLAAILAIVVWLTWPSQNPGRTPRALTFQDFDVCLLTSSEGITAEPAATTFAGLQQVTAEAAVRLSYLAVTGDQTAQRAELFVATLAQQACDIIVAVGQPQVTAAANQAAAHPQIRFLTVETSSDTDTTIDQIRSLIPRR